MLPNLKNRPGAKSLQILICAVMAFALAACGGGGGSPGVTSGGSGTGTGTGTGGTTVTNDPTVTMTIVDVTGADVSSLSGGQKGTIKATVKDSKGKVLPNEIVTFVASNPSLVVFDQASALTNADGVAVNRVSPASVESVGALSITATTVIQSKTASATKNIAVGAAPLTLTGIAFASTPPAPLPAFSTVALNITITSAGAPATSVTGLTLSSLCVGDGTAKIVSGGLVNGVQSATYTNNGCLRGNDTITASVGSSSQSISLAVGAANIGTIQFIGSDLQGSSIVLKGSGGLGRKESALLTFRVIDQNNNGLAGVDVNFRATTTTGGLTVAPDKGTTDAAGNVTTTVSSGTIPTPVRVIAEATRNGVTISGLSDALVVSTGLPIQRNMSLSFDSYNIEGLGHDGEIANATVRLADQYGNPISDNTAVNFVTEGGAVGSSSQGACLTSNGACSVPLKSQAFRPVNGRVSVLAYVQGVENFVDTNGDGMYSCSNVTDPSGQPTSNYRPLVDICVSGGETFTDQGDPFLDTGKPAKTLGVPAVSHSFDGSYDPAQGDLPIPYNHVGYSAAGNGKWGINYISAQAEVTFSGSDPTLIRQFYDSVTKTWRDWNEATDGDERIITGVSGVGCSIQPLRFRIFDVNNNPMPRDTVIGSADAEKLTAQSISPDKVASTSAIGGTIHTLNVKPDSSCADGYFSVTVTTPKAVKQYFNFRSK